MITLPTEPSKLVLELGKQTILLYSAPKLGKSTMASRFPSAIFLECEPGLNHLEVFKVPTYSWEAFLEACKLIAKGDHKFQTVVIDTVDIHLSICPRLMMILPQQRLQSMTRCPMASIRFASNQYDLKAARRVTQ